eukprot:CAMPEP_0119054606 /NCGR_PEP_ID=MMETSP1177-20130426/75184_1 /TAXON_ID=2985 /ORGANISM="Ochromonas sp, Strain CCMP1899" /LENGTH=370 /DNA_ID=CAMNT_0007034909 /DNA_START=429 /DNA_END=1542 /DNA_ORIENTATION=+
MADLSTEFEVAVIDEAQLFGDESRGWAWTQAFLGLKAKEIHLCGSISMLPIVKNLCLLAGDTLTVKNYSRLTPLTVCAKSLKSYKNIEKGDCIVGFGRKGLYDTKATIERNNPGLKCCVIYGGLPPDARKQQAKLFSTPDSGYDVLIASDAIGMGLNLAIKRIIFSAVEKFDGRKKRRLFPAELKQIAGRAGRYGTVYEHGEVTCMNSDDLKYVRHGMQAIDRPIQKAGLYPTLEQLELLGVIVDYQVTDAMMLSFWNNHLNKEWDIDENNETAINEWGIEINPKKTEKKTENNFQPNLSTTEIMKKFGNIENFAFQLEDFLKNSTGHCKDGVLEEIQRLKDRKQMLKYRDDYEFYVDEEQDRDFDDLIG